MREKEFSFYFIKLPWKRVFFMQEFNWKICTNRNFPNFGMKVRIEEKKIWLVNALVYC